MILNCIFHILRAISCSQCSFSFLQLADEALLGASRASNLKDLDNADLCYQAANSVFKVVQGWLERGEEHLHDMPDSQKLLNDFKDTCSKHYVPPTPVSVFAFGCIRISEVLTVYHQPKARPRKKINFAILRSLHGKGAQTVIRGRYLVFLELSVTSN